MKIQAILDTKGSEKVFTITASATLTELVNQVANKNIGALLVTNASGDVTGIISERDVVRQCSKSMDFDNITVGEIMTKDVVTAHPDDDMNVAMDMMVTKKIRHLPVLSEGTIHGLITVRDLIYAMREADKEELHKLVSYLQESISEHA